jgi:GNAT superfamily N-acetyltransferase
MSLGALTPPEVITAEHQVADFDSGEKTLDDWLKKRALKNSASGASRCFVLCSDKVVIGYYSLAASAIGHETAPKAMRRNMPDPLPALLLGRLAVDRKHHNQGLGSALLRDAMLRSVTIARDTGVFGMLLHALHEKAKQFYLSRGFVQSPLQEMTLVMTMATVEAILTEPN